MSENNQHPREYDAVLGGNSPPPVNGVVLGGVEGLKRRLETGNTQQRVDSLADAVKYDDAGVDLLIEALKDADIEVRAKAYELLKNQDSKKARKSIVNGIPLNIGDKVYCVYQSSLSYGDDWYYLDNEITDFYEEDYPFYKACIGDKEGYSFYITDSQKDIDLDEYYDPKLIFIFFDESEAQKAAKSLHLKRLLEIEDVEFGMIDTEKEPIDLDAWCQENRADFTRNNGEEDWKFLDRIFRILLKDKNVEMLNKLWTDTVNGNLSFIHERIIDKNCYFKPTKSYK
ncbi:MAG: hypothetical protein AAF349_03350 [Cyanobacteria bacterium P01_A01_bin.68]